MRIVAAFLLLSGLLRAASIRVPVWTQPNQGLKADGLTVTVGGEPASVVRMQGPGDDLMILLVLDLVGDLNKIERAREGLVRAVSELPPKAYVGILRAQGGLRVLLDPTGERPSIERVIREFPVSGTPGLLETIEPASNLADAILEDSPVRIAVLYVTDSEIDEYREDFTNPVVNRSDSGDLSRRFPEGVVRDRVARLAAKLASSQAPVFAVHLDYNTNRLEEAYQSGILQMTTTTGGDAVFCRSDTEIPEALESMMQKIVAHHAVDVEVPAGIRDETAIALESLSAGELSYRTRYDVGSD